MKRYNIIINEPALNQEITERHKDFAHVLALHESYQRKKRKTKPYKTIGGILLLIITVSAVWFLPGLITEPNTPTFPKAVQHEATPEPSEQTTDPAALAITDQGEEGSVRKKDSEKPAQEQTKETEKQALPESQKKPAPKEQQPKDSGEKGEELIYTEASPKIGMEGLHQYFREHLLYPEQELLEGKEGTVIVSFVINKAGKAEDIKIVHAVSPGIDQETIRLIREMPAWNPANVNGQAIASRISLPLTFNLTDYEKQ